MTFRILLPDKRKQRNTRAFNVCIRFVLPDPWLRSRIGNRLRRRFSWLNQACYRWFGWVMISRLMLLRYSKDDLELRSYSLDIRQILSDNALMEQPHNLHIEWRVSEQDP